MTTRVEFIECIADETLRAKEQEATEAVRKICPGAGPVKLYRTADGRVGFQINQLAGVAGQRDTFDQVYRAIMGVLGQRRGRPPGVKTVQTKLRLPETLYRRLKSEARHSRESLSALVTRQLAASHAKGPERRRGAA